MKKVTYLSNFYFNVRVCDTHYLINVLLKFFAAIYIFKKEQQFFYPHGQQSYLKHLINKSNMI